jgi:hypothetical protein
MRRKILFGAVALLGLILILVVSVFWYIRSGRLDLYLQGQIIAALKDIGIDAEIGQAHLDLAGYKVTLSDVVLKSAKTQKPIGSVRDSHRVQSSPTSNRRSRSKRWSSPNRTSASRWILRDALRLMTCTRHPNVRTRRRRSFISAYIEVIGGKLSYGGRVAT